MMDVLVLGNFFVERQTISGLQETAAARFIHEGGKLADEFSSP